MKAKRIYFPALALFITLCACLIPVFACCVALAAQLAPLPHPHWLIVCLQYNKTLDRASLVGIGVATLGSFFTLWLLLKTEPPVTTRFHLKNIVTGIVFGAVSGLLMGGFAMGMTFLQAFQAPGGLNRLGSLEAIVGEVLIGMAVLALGFGVLCLIVMVIPYALYTLISRARQPYPALPLAAAQTPHNSPEYFHHTH